MSRPILYFPALLLAPTLAITKRTGGAVLTYPTPTPLLSHVIFASCSSTPSQNHHRAALPSRGFQILGTGLGFLQCRAPHPTTLVTSSLAAHQSTKLLHPHTWCNPTRGLLFLRPRPAPPRNPPSKLSLELPRTQSHSQCALDPHGAFPHLSASPRFAAHRLPSGWIYLDFAPHAASFPYGSLPRTAPDPPCSHRRLRPDPPDTPTPSPYGTTPDDLDASHLLARHSSPATALPAPPP